jgi:hypothetical protein
MHGPALARSQWRPVSARRARSWTLENWLTWHRTSRSRTHRGSCRGARRRSGARGRGRPQWRFVNRPRPSLGNDHSWRRHCRRRRRTRGCRSGRHVWRWWHRRCSPRGRCSGRNRSRRRTRWHNRRSHRSRRCRSRRSGGQRRSGRSWNRKGWPRSRSRNYKFRWYDGRRWSWRLGDGNGRWRRRRRSCGLGRNRRRSRWRRVRNGGPLLLADNSF